MAKFNKYIAWCLFGGMGLFFANCGKLDDFEAQQEQKRSAQLWLFGAPWCEPCTKELRDVQALMGAQLGEAQQRVSVTVHVVSILSDKKKKVPPTEEGVQQYAKLMEANHGVRFPMKPDPWRYKTYRSFFRRPGPIPAAVILDENGETLKVFKPGTFGPDDIVNALEEAIF